jgi:hypothetical protein
MPPQVVGVQRLTTHFRLNKYHALVSCATLQNNKNGLRINDCASVIAVLVIHVAHVLLKNRLFLFDKSHLQQLARTQAD